MHNTLFRCHSLGRIMTEPKTKAEGILSVGAKTYIRSLAQQEIFGIDFEFSSKETQKGLEVEQECIELLNRVRGLSLVKNTERRTNTWLSGECDLFDAASRRGHDIKASWSAKTFPGWLKDCMDPIYEWQMRAYMMLWDADEWQVDYCLVNTPDKLIGYEPLPMHIVDHIAEHHRVTSWTIKRDLAKEALIQQRLEAAQEYFRQALTEFDQTHSHHTDMAAAYPQAQAAVAQAMCNAVIADPFAA